MYTLRPSHSWSVWLDKGHHALNGAFYYVVPLMNGCDLKVYIVLLFRFANLHGWLKVRGHRLLEFDLECVTYDLLGTYDMYSDLYVLFYNYIHTYMWNNVWLLKLLRAPCKFEVRLLYHFQNKTFFRYFSLE